MGRFAPINPRVIFVSIYNPHIVKVVPVKLTHYAKKDRFAKLKSKKKQKEEKREIEVCNEQKIQDVEQIETHTEESGTFVDDLDGFEASEMFVEFDNSEVDLSLDSNF